ncbi:zinc finger protein OZF isoform X2 [Tribolium castaneum]|uniref:Zinc finger protein 26-like Protein n=1 Tax=Tribolium castaneum TaxID=7070 RepID=D2A4S9_TRICA|nr:PREDICTED: zinc finger protein OZF isoform X2 [Tribolium castaneum]EFA05263.2 Zinc finger protein 26-like Protein [Tribolium castaneum]|eukprot:XP_008194501.1 PREDICTED: zinc finger protein OZF isoform X2 [Tribolium castaneum]
MQPPEGVGARLSDVCRTCLVKSPHMTSFSPKNETTSHLIAMLSSVGNIEIEVNDLLPSYLCKKCEEKLRLSYDFQLMIQRSNEIVRECISGADMAQEVSEKIEIKIEDNRRKLPEFSAFEVQEAINECQGKFSVKAECIKCGFVTSNSRALSVHMSYLHKEMKERWCSTCNSEVENLETHTLSHVNSDFKCKFCGRTFKTRGNYTEHLRCHSSVKPHNCHICRKEFTAKRHLDKHLRTHSLPTQEVDPLGEAQNYCIICKRRVRSLKAHLLKCHSSDPKKPDGCLCTLCGKKFSSLSRFRVHMRTHTGEAPYKCRYCDKRSASRNHIVVHERTHTGEKPHICTVCGKAFAQSSVLNTHMKIHTGRPIACEICDKRFCRPAQLRLHVRKHTGEKPYQCTECEQAFRQRSHLTEHLKTHSDDRPYKCSHCEKGFKQISTLKSHIQIHLGTKPFKCSQCPYACRQSYSLTKHMKQHSLDAPRAEKPHFCHLCQRGFTTMAMLTSHNSGVHGF